MVYHAPDCLGAGAGCDGCGYIGPDDLWHAGPSPTGTTVDASGDYPVVISIPDGPYFARQPDPDEGYLPEQWVVIDERTGRHVAVCSRRIAHHVVGRLNRRK